MLKQSKAQWVQYLFFIKCRGTRTQQCWPSNILDGSRLKSVVCPCKCQCLPMDISWLKLFKEIISLLQWGCLQGFKLRGEKLEYLMIIIETCVSLGMCAYVGVNMQLDIDMHFLNQSLSRRFPSNSLFNGSYMWNVDLNCYAVH